MAKIVIHQELIADKEAVIALCPFKAIEVTDGKVEINAACKMCKMCVRKGPEGAFEFIEEKVEAIDKSQWVGICVYVDHVDGDIHPVTMELIGKAKSMAAVINQPVYALFAGYNIADKANELLHYGVDKVFVYDDKELQYFRIEPYTAVFEDFINTNKPGTCIVGGTNVGRSLAPRVAARFRTGLTADCTVLEMNPNTDLDQIRPAFGGNIMAHIHTPNHRPQFATARYKIFTAPERSEEASGEIVECKLAAEKFASNIEVKEVHVKEQTKSIEDAEVLVVAGRPFNSAEKLAELEALAHRLGGMLAVTRPLVEAGLADARLQIGLSGRTVKPKLIITCGVAGYIQFVAGMDKSDTIIAINTDPEAQIFGVAHYAIVGDVFEVLPKLVEKLEAK